MNLLKNVLGGWIGLNNTVETFYVDKEYKYKCDNICKKPSNVNDLLQNMTYYNLDKNVSDMEIIKQNANSGKLYFRDNIKSDAVKKSLQSIDSDSNAEGGTNCRLYYSFSKNDYEYVPVNCIHKFGPNVPILNNLDNKTYTFLESSSTPVTGKTPTFIFKAPDANMIFVIFGFGYAPEDIDTETKQMENKQNIVRFIANTLVKYLNEDVMIVLCGHSAGIVNAFLVGEELYHSVMDNKYNLSIVQKTKRVCEDKEFDYDDDLKNVLDKIKREYDMYNDMLIADEIQLDKITKSLEIEIEKCGNNIKDKLRQLIPKIDDCDQNEDIYDYIYPRYPDYPPKEPIGYEKSLLKEIHTILSECENQQKILGLIISKCKTNKSRQQSKLNRALYMSDGIRYKNEMGELERIHNENKLTRENLLKYRQFILHNSKQLHDKIFICGSAGYPCFGNKTIKYDDMKKFYHNRILHFRLPKDYFLEKNLNKTLNLYRTDLIELSGNDIIFHTMQKLIDEQKQKDYTSLTNMSKEYIYINHNWSNYITFLNKLYFSEQLINKIIIAYNITDNLLIGGSYYNKYIKYKKKYIELAKENNKK